MYANEKPDLESMKKPGDFIKISDGIVLICKCGETISIGKRWSINYDPLDISPSINHLNSDDSSKCHYFIKNGEYIQA